MKLRTTLLLIDAQHDFCDPSGSLYVNGAEKDTQVIAQFIMDNLRNITEIKSTLDSHPISLHVGNASYWRNSDGSAVSPFTIITAEMVRRATVKPLRVDLYQEALEYVEALERNGRYPLCGWPDHCRIGTLGATLMPEILAAFDAWSRLKGINIDFVAKGSNYKTEHYSAIQADVPDPKDPGTNVDADLIKSLDECDRLVIAGEALSHCVANTVRDIVALLGDTYAQKLVLMEDGSSSVPGFENLGDAFKNELSAKGMKILPAKGIF